MVDHSQRIKLILNNPFGFIYRIITGFLANQGLLLSGAVAYYTLLSIVPIFALILIALSQIMDKQQLLVTASAYLELVAAGYSTVLIQQIALFLDEWKLVGIVGVAVLIFFSSFAFTVLENAISVIFYHRVAIHRRHFLISAILPYCYILLLALGLMVVTAISAGLHAVQAKSIVILGFDLSIDVAFARLAYVLGIFGEILLLTSLYLLMPVGRLAFRHAVIGGVTATVLWELTRHVLVWFFSTLSIVNVIYGSFASAIVILLSFEAGALIVLLGAQVIAEYERVGILPGRPVGLST
jgi:membrane protein